MIDANITTTTIAMRANDWIEMIADTCDFSNILVTYTTVALNFRTVHDDYQEFITLPRSGRFKWFPIEYDWGSKSTGSHENGTFDKFVCAHS